MASTIILSDNGVSSGSAGIKTTGGNDGVLLLQTATAGGTATTAVAITNTQNVGVGTSTPSKKLEVGSLGVFRMQTGSTAFDVTPTAGAIDTLVWNTSNSGSAFAWNTNSTERMRLDQNGNLGIAKTNPQYNLDIGGTGSAAVGFSGTAASSNTYRVGQGVVGVTNAGFSIYDIGASATRMVIDSSGNLLVGATSTATNFSTKFTLSTDSGTTKWAVGPSLASATQFVVSASGSAGVYLATTSATSWSAISDERHKDIIAPITNAVQKVSTLRCVIGKYKDDETNTQKPFLIAQDVLAVQPEAVDTSNPERFGLAYTDLIPLLTAAIQEQQALITTLTERITALEAK